MVEIKVSTIWALSELGKTLFQAFQSESRLWFLEAGGWGFLGHCRCHQKSPLAPHGHCGLLGLYYVQGRKEPGPLPTLVSLAVFLFLRQFCVSGLMYLDY